MMEKIRNKKFHAKNIFSIYSSNILNDCDKKTEITRSWTKKNARIHLSDVERLIEPRFF